MSTITIFSLPSELIVAIDEHNRSHHTVAKQYIGITPLAPVETNGLRHTSQHLKRVFDSKLYGFAEFFYSSSGTGSHDPCLDSPSAAVDLLNWFDELGEPVNGRRVRKLSLEMYGPEFLLLFAPPEAASLLNLSADRGNWTRAARRLRALRLNRLKIRILAETCPRPCSAGKRTRAEADGDGSTPTHFHADPIWAVKAIQETWLPYLPEHCHVQLFTTRHQDQDEDHDQLTQHISLLSSSDLKRIQSSSWRTLHGAVNAWHICDTLDVYASAPDTTTLHKAAPVFGDWVKSPPPFLCPKDRPEGEDGWDWSHLPDIDDLDQNAGFQGEEWVCPAPCVREGLSEMTGGDEWEAVDGPKRYRVPVVFVNATRKQGRGGAVESTDLEGEVALGLARLGL
ncbi:hypothetical protein LTR86_007764 [Recurvomyces mirabilis]|nr:hypothetical protein LTR86_007764 [Recurvomyces mirabilis]